MPVISGRCVEYYTKKPVAGAVINVDGYSSYTGNNGNFSVQSPFGTATLSITHRDFDPYIETLNVNKAFLSLPQIKLTSRLVAL